MALNEITEAIDIAQKRAALKAELDRLEKQEEEVKARAHADAVEQAQALINHFDIAPDEVTFKAKRILVPRFIDRETGETWHGYGKRPHWINDDNFEDCRIKPEEQDEAAGKESIKKNQQAESKPAQAEADQREAGNAVAEAAAVDSVTTKSEVAAVAANVAPEATHNAVSEFAQQPVSGQGQQPTSPHGFPLCAAGVQSYVTAVRDAWSS